MPWTGLSLTENATAYRERRIKGVTINPEQLIGMTGIKAAAVEGVYFDHDTNQFVVRVFHADFPTVPDGAVTPRVTIDDPSLAEIGA